jgi:hypothetical protein
MTISTVEHKIYWTASQTSSISSGGNKTSDTASFTSTLIDLSISLKADNDGTPATGDTVDCYFLPTLGDPDGSGTAEYTTTGHGIFLARLDTITEDPAITVVRLNPTVQAMRLYCVNNSSGRAITVSATMYEKLG